MIHQVLVFFSGEDVDFYTVAANACKHAACKTHYGIERNGVGETSNVSDGNKNAMSTGENY